MKDLETIKEEVIKGFKYHNWRDAMEFSSFKEIDLITDKIAERYANEVRTHALQEAAEKAEYLKSETEVTDYCKGYNHAMNIVRDAVLSLIKEKQK